MPPAAKTSRKSARPRSDAPTRAGRVPGEKRYRQVADALRDQITSGVLPPASPLPSEAQLVATFDVSRPTARAAVAALVAEGLVVTLHGRGSFVRRADDRPAHTHRRGVESTDGRLTDSEVDNGRWQPLEPPATYRTDASADLALALGVAEHAPLFVCDRLLADSAGRRMFVRSYVPFAVAADVPALEADPFLVGGALYAALAEGLRRGHRLAWTDMVRARMPSPDDAAALRIPPGTPMLTIRRTTRDVRTGQAPAGGSVLAVEDTRVSAEDAQLAFDLTPPSPAAG